MLLNELFADAISAPVVNTIEPCLSMTSWEILTHSMLSVDALCVTSRQEISLTVVKVSKSSVVPVVYVFRFSGM